MNFSKKLKILLNIFNVSSRKLANVIHLDPSSVSRWLNNKRIPSPNSVLVDKVIDYFLNLDAFEFQKTEFLRMIAPNDPNNPMMNSMQIVKLFREWLFSPIDIVYKNNQSKYTTENLNESHISELLNNIGNYPSKNTFENQANNSVLYPGQKKEMEVFYGDAGIKQALIHLGSELLNTNILGELLITSQDNFFWYNNPEFMAEWIDLLKKILQKGHKIKILYNLTHGLPEVTHLIIGWLPLFATGNFDAYYYPKYVDNTINITLAAVPGLGAICSTISEDESLYGSTFFYRDFSVVEYFKTKLNKLISNAKPLIFLYSSKNTLALHEELLEIEESHGCRLVCKNGLTSLTIPLPLFRKLLDKSSLTKSQKQKRYALQKLRLETLKTKSNLSSYMDICFIDSLESMINPKGYEYFPLDIFSSGVLMAEPCDALEHLKNTVEMLQSLDNFEIALVPRNDYFGGNTMYWAVKEDLAVLVSTWDTEDNPICILIKENTVVNEFERYFENTWDKIPQNNRDKSWVVKKLQSKIKRLEKMVD